jgi:hypothetical protein
MPPTDQKPPQNVIVSPKTDVTKIFIEKYAGATKSPAEDARIAFEAIAAFEREAKIVALQDILARLDHLGANIQIEVGVRNWRAVEALAMEMLLELSQSNIHTIASSIQSKMRDMVALIQSEGPKGVDSFLAWTGGMAQVVEREGRRELELANRAGRGAPQAVDKPARTAIVEAAHELFEHRYQSDATGKEPFAPREFWIKLAAALYGEGDVRAQEMKLVKG